MKILDIEFLDADYDDCPHILIKVFDSFKKTHKELLADCREALENSDLETVGKKAHTLKGSIKSIGGLQSAEYAKQLELLSEGGKDLDLANELFQKLEAAIIQLEVELTNYIEKLNP